MKTTFKSTMQQKYELTIIFHNPYECDNDICISIKKNEFPS